MMNENLQVFTYEGNKVRTVMVDGEPWFVLKDLCKILGISNGSYVAAKLDEGDKCIRPMDTTGGKQRLGTVSENGLYTVISKCNKKYAAPFRKWIENEVLPSVYGNSSKQSSQTALNAKLISKSVQAVTEAEGNKISTNVQIFNNPEFGDIRTIIRNDEMWFVGKDIATALGYSNPSKAVMVHVEADDKDSIMIGFGASSQNGNLPSGGTKTTIVNESGMYALIFGSKLESAMKFKRWVTSEVLPSIRKHGAYMTPETLQAAILNPDTLIQLCQQLKAEQEKNRALSEKNAELAPKAEFADAITASDDCISIAVFAKIMNQNGVTIDGRRVGQNILFEALREHGFLCSSYSLWNVARQEYVNRGFFQVTERIKPNGEVYHTTKITPAGQKYILNYFKEFMNCEVE